MAEIAQATVDSLAAKITALDLTDDEAAAFDALISAAEQAGDGGVTSREAHRAGSKRRRNGGVRRLDQCGRAA